MAIERAHRIECAYEQTTNFNSTASHFIAGLEFLIVARLIKPGDRFEYNYFYMIAVVLFYYQLLSEHCF